MAEKDLIIPPPVPIEYIGRDSSKLENFFCFLPLVIWCAGFILSIFYLIKKI